jgi:hypothetical protein
MTAAKQLTDDQRQRIRRATFVAPAPTPQGVSASIIALVPQIVALLKPKNRPWCPACYVAPRNRFQKPIRRRMEFRLIGDRFVWSHCSIIRPCDKARLASFCEAHGIVI